MKKQYPVTQKARSWAKHLKPEGKRRANKATRKITKADTSLEPGMMSSVWDSKERDYES